MTAYYEKIKRVVSASGCTKSWVVKRKFEDRTCARRLPRRPHRQGLADANAATPATPPDGSAAAAPDGEGPPPAPSPGGKGGGGKAGKAGGGGKKAFGKA